jgi:hypothetical protein
MAPSTSLTCLITSFRSKSVRDLAVALNGQVLHPKEYKRDVNMKNMRQDVFYFFIK